MADEFKLTKLAESKGLKPDIIKTLQEQDIDNVDDIVGLSDDDIMKLKLSIGQTNRLKKWIKEVKREYHSYVNKCYGPI